MVIFFPSHSLTVYLCYSSHGIFSDEIWGLQDANSPHTSAGDNALCKRVSSKARFALAACPCADDVSQRRKLFSYLWFWSYQPTFIYYKLLEVMHKYIKEVERKGGDRNICEFSSFASLIAFVQLWPCCWFTTAVWHSAARGKCSDANSFI